MINRVKSTNALRNGLAMTIQNVKKWINFLSGFMSIKCPSFVTLCFAR